MPREKLIDDLRPLVLEYHKIFPKESVRQISEFLKINKSMVQRILRPPEAKERLNVGKRLRMRQRAEMLERHRKEQIAYNTTGWKALLARQEAEFELFEASWPKMQ